VLIKAFKISLRHILTYSTSIKSVYQFIFLHDNSLGFKVVLDDTQYSNVTYIIMRQVGI